MLFNSLAYPVFLLLVTCLYFALPHRFRWALLLAASYYFYACWRVEYLGLIVLSTLIDYCAALGMGATDRPGRRRLYMGLSLAGNLGMLFFFKYATFAAESINFAFERLDVISRLPLYHILLPVGISFYTFQSLSYTMDVYWGRRAPERHFGIFALYVSFFPQLVAGPIETSTRLLPQLRRENRFDMAALKLGLLFILLGFFKKLVIADRVAVMVSAVYAAPGDATALEAALSFPLFLYQIYCDFSGYSDIAVGSAMIMGYDLMRNFNRPFAARSMRELWQRWHISLTRWVGTYLYVPVARRLPRRIRRYVMPTFIMGAIGLWHGASWLFVAWGIYFGLIITLEEAWAALTAPGRPLARLRARISPPESGPLGALYAFGAACTVSALMCLATPLFLAETVANAMTVYSRALGAFSGGDMSLPHWSRYETLLGIIFIVLLEIGQWVDSRWPMAGLVQRAPLWVRWPAYYALCFVVVGFGQFNLTPFVYFQF